MKKLIIAIVGVLLLAGCATVYRVKVNGYLSPGRDVVYLPSGASFYVLPEQNSRNLIFESEIKSKIEALLSEKGFRILPREQADFYLTYIYSPGSGRQVTEIRPVYQPAETGTIQKITEEGKAETSFITFPGYTSYVPYRYTLYTYSLALEVVDARLARSTKEEKQLWIGEASSSLENPDHREAVNYLLVALFEHFGEDTHRSLKVDISAKNPGVKKLMQ
ncbi:MAG: membrane lipoprotein lipid attachment site-containing protein [Candidatus Omnitrophota bacterium]